MEAKKEAALWAVYGFVTTYPRCIVEIYDVGTDREVSESISGFLMKRGVVRTHVGEYHHARRINIRNTERRIKKGRRGIGTLIVFPISRTHDIQEKIAKIRELVTGNEATQLLIITDI